MEFITDFYVFLASVLLISFSGVLLPGPLFAITIKKSLKNKTAGALIAVGHAIVEVPLMLLILFVLSQFNIPSAVQVSVSLFGGFLMIVMGFQAFRNRNKKEEDSISLKRDSLLAGAWTTAANAGFILWWLTIGTTLILNAKIFGLLGFSVFAGVHWLTDFSWYTMVALLIFRSQRFWTERAQMGITFFCISIFIGFGAYFMVSALWSLF